MAKCKALTGSAVKGLIIIVTACPQGACWIWNHNSSTTLLLLLASTDNDLFCVSKDKDTEAGEVSDVLLACDCSRLSQHCLRGGRTSRPTTVSHRLFVYDVASRS